MKVHRDAWLRVVSVLVSLLWSTAHGDAPGIIHYQGRLALGTNLYSGPVSAVFRLFNAPAGGTLLHTSTNLATAVDGLYATTIGQHGVVGNLDVALTNAQVWLEVEVNGTTLSPRERLLAVPYAQAVRGLRVVGTNNIVLNAEQGMNRISGSGFSAIGGGVGNQISDADSATIGGGYFNAIQLNAFYATIGGGVRNTIQTNADYAAIGGGYYNFVLPGATFATVGGGELNVIDRNANYAAIGGGSQNNIQTNADYASIGGGSLNIIQTDASAATIGGGAFNDIGPNAAYAAIGGGVQNDIQTNARYATIPGGTYNRVGPFATNAFAAGRRAKANHRGAFVWGDDTAADVVSTNNNQVTFRASGGYRIFSNTNMTLGVILNPNATAWSAISDREAKENIAPLDPQDVLHGVRQLPLSSWNYKADPGHRRYIGPMAQDFHAQFGLGDERTINTLDADGVLFAAIQALAAENENMRGENEELRRRLEALEARLSNF